MLQFSHEASHRLKILSLSSPPDFGQESCAKRQLDDWFWDMWGNVGAGLFQPPVELCTTLKSPSAHGVEISY